MHLAASDDEDYQRVIEVLRVFSAWCRLVSTTDTDLPEERVQEISCREAHSDDMKCCQTAALGQALESIGGFGSSGLVHVMVMHLGHFLFYFLYLDHFRPVCLEAQANRSCSGRGNRKNSFETGIRN
jgi:hypothetical protein